MRKIRLAISDGGHVADVSVPEFLKMPEVVIWGDRFFGFHEMLPEPEDECVAEYREVFAYFIIPEVKE
jgi:hypothetical protein